MANFNRDEAKAIYRIPFSHKLVEDSLVLLQCLVRVSLSKVGNEEGILG